MRRELNENLSGNDVYHKVCSLLVNLKNSCSKLHYQKGFNPILFSYKISGILPELGHHLVQILERRFCSAVERGGTT